MNLRRRFVEVPGVRLAVLDSGGAGTPVVFVHANTGTSASWAEQLEAFATAGFRAIAFDGRGCGESETLRDDSPQPGSMEGDLAALIGALGLGAVHLVGSARGAICGLGFAASRPGLLRSLVVAGTYGCPEEPEIRAFLDATRIEALEARAFAAARELSAGYRGLDQRVGEWEAVEAHAHQLGSLPQPPTWSPNSYPRLEAIAVPVLALAGSADLLSPPALMRLFAAHLKDVELVVLDEVGHAIAWERPRRFNELALAFVTRHDH